MISGSWIRLVLTPTPGQSVRNTLIRSPNALAFTAVLKRSLTIVTPVTQAGPDSSLHFDLGGNEYGTDYTGDNVVQFFVGMSHQF